MAGQYGLESTVTDYVETMRAVFAQTWRVLADHGTLWLNLGDSYASPPPGRSDHAMRSSTLASSGVQTAAMRESVRLAGIDRSRQLPAKNLLGIPWRVAFALQDDGWILRNAIVWHKPNAMPESVRDRLSGRHEQIFLFAKHQRYWFDLDAIREAPATHGGRSWVQRRADGEPAQYGRAGQQAAGRGGFTGHEHGRNPGDVWTTTRHPDTDYRLNRDHKAVNPGGANPGDVWSISTRPNPQAHFAVMPIDIPIRCIKAGCKPGGTVLDPFSGSGTTGQAARLLGRKYIGIDLNPAYQDLAVNRFAQGLLDFDAPTDHLNSTS